MRQPSLRLFSVAFLAMLLVGSVSMLSGCAGEGEQNVSSQQQTAENKDLKLSLAEINQLLQLDEQSTDGQFVVLKLNALNQTSAELSISLSDFELLAFEPNEEGEVPKEPTYKQKAEKNLISPFRKVFGKQAAEKLLGTSPEVLQPRIDSTRYLVFILPKQAKLNQYQLVWTPASGEDGFSVGNTKKQEKSIVPIKLPLLAKNGSTVVNDRRNETQSAS